MFLVVLHRFIAQLNESFSRFVDKIKPIGKFFPGPQVSLKTKKITSIPYKKRDFKLKVFGEFNQINASLAFSVGEQLGLQRRVITGALENYTSLHRRMEFVGEFAGIKVFDDYAHHPTAIGQTLKAVREVFPNERIWCVYQPHMFSRTRALFTDFVDVFRNAPTNYLIVTDICAAREKVDVGVNSKDLVKETGNKRVRYIGELEEAASFLAGNVAAGDVVVCMGAGDIYKVSRRLLEKLQGQNGSYRKNNR